MKLAQTLKAYRCVDLSKVIVPGDAKGPVGAGKRKFEIRPFAYPPGETMHQVDMENHIGTHVEAPSHFVDARHGRKGMDIAQLPLARLFGEAVLVDAGGFPPGHAITADDARSFGVRKDDIVLFGNSGRDGEQRPWVTGGAARWLAETGIKLAGIDDSVFPEEPRWLSKDLSQYHTHDALLSNDIPFIEGLANLGALGRRRFYFFGLVTAIQGMDAWPIRAVAFVPPEGEKEVT